jgi:hypothetical protein
MLIFFLCKRRDINDEQDDVDWWSIGVSRSVLNLLDGMMLAGGAGGFLFFYWGFPIVVG